MTEITYELRSASYPSISPDFIDCEFNHPVYGWIPFTAHKDDSEQHGRGIHAALVAGQAGDIAPYVPPAIEVIQTQAWEAIKAERTKRMNEGGFHVVVNGVQKWFHSTQESRIQYIGLVNFGDNLPTDISWKTMDGSFVTMTPSLANSLIGHAAISDQTIFAAAEAHRAAMLQVIDPLTYDFSAGWPTAFWERQ